jgi:mannose-1-phosphate guanylyltransferase/mannose-6-phosphate isomerase
MKESSNIGPVVLAGGSGTRLWPLSRTDYPKQFLPLGGELSLLQQTVNRFTESSARSPVVVCSENHRFLTAEQLSAIGQDKATIILEPAARNTAPAIALAAWHVLKQDPDAVLVVLPADHLIADTAAFQSAITDATALAEQGFLVTLGIAPDGPETGYGYIEAGVPLQGSDGAGRVVQRFVEKPDLETARSLIAGGKCFWNAGIFIFRASVFLDVLATLQPLIHASTREAIGHATVDLDFLRVERTAFERCPNISVDYAVMEHADNVVVLPYTSSWSDIGSWDAVHKAAAQDEQGNAGVGDVLHYNTRDTYLHSSSRLIVALGTHNISVIETSDAILVIDHASAQSIKQAIEILQKQNRTELNAHTTCYRPWGHYESLKLHPRFQVKRINVKPGARLSLQKHFHRSEHWVVVRGTAIVTNGEEELLLTENESTYIPLGTMHRLFNPGTIPLEIIEVQSGSYLGEDDIVRFEDTYGRATA